MVEAGLAKWDSDKYSVNALLACINFTLSLESEIEIEIAQVGGSWKETVYTFSTMSENT